MKQSYADILKELSKEKKTPDNIADKVLVVDGLNTFLRAYAVSPSSTDEGIHIGGISGFLYSLGFAIKRFSPTRCIVVFDGVGGSKRRKKIFPEYKANRGSAKKAKYNRAYDFQDDVNDDQMKSLQLARLMEYLEILPITVICIDNIEADDTMAYITQLNDKSNYVIMSADRDFLQLVDTNVKVWSPTKKKVYTTEKVMTEYGVHPHNFAIMKAINGDVSDNIPGIKGFGPKTIQKHFEFLIEEKRHTLDDLVVEAKKKLKYKACQAIVDNEEILNRNYDLMQLEESIIGGQTKLRIVGEMECKINRLNKYQFHIMSMTDKLFAIIKNINTWVLLFDKLNLFAGKYNEKLDGE